MEEEKKEYEHEDFPRINKPEEGLKQENEGCESLKYGHILQDSFIYLLVGLPGSGKSHLINEFILRPDFYYEEFNRIIYISPSRVHPKFTVNAEYYSRDLNEDYIYSVIDNLTEITRACPDKQFNFLFIIDDCIAALRHLEESSIITNLFFNRRHIIPGANISLILTTQEIKSICLKIRAVVTGMFLFSPNPRELDLLSSEMIFDKELLFHIKDIMKNYFSFKEHEFFYIELIPELELYYNFLEIE